MAKRDTIGTNETELFAARQLDPKQPPVGAIWHEKEPNSYDAFGEEQNRTSRRPINSSRMAKKGLILGATSTVGYNQDLTAENSIFDFESFLFAERRSKGDVTSTTIVADGYTVPSGGDKFKSGDIIIVEGEGVNTVNLGVKVLTDNGTNAKVLFATTADAGAKVRIRKCGHRFAAGKATITVANGLPTLNTIDFDATTLGIIPGEVVYLGSDIVTNRYNSATNQGWCRVLSVTAAGILFDKTDEVFVADNGAGKSIDLWFGTVVKNEKQSELQSFMAWAFRRRLGRADTESDVVQSEVNYAGVASELSFNLPEEDKITFDVTYMCRKYQTFENDADVDPTGTIQRVNEADAITTAKDSRRIRLGVYPRVGDAISSKLVLLFPAYNEATLEINNNIQENKAITYQGAYAHTPGFFDVMLNMNCYFTEVQGLAAISENRDLTFDFAAVKDNKGFAIDLPLIGVSTPGPELEANEAIMLEIEGEAADASKYNSALDHAMLVVFFPYLPNVAAD